MKKLYIIILLFFVIPVVASAAWWNPLSWGSGNVEESKQSTPSVEVLSLQKIIAQQNIEIGDLKKEIQSLSQATTSISSGDRKTVTLTKYLPCPVVEESSNRNAAVRNTVNEGKQASTTIPIRLNTTKQTSGIKNYQSYQKVSMDDLMRNPFLYSGKEIVVSGNISGYVPFGSKGNGFGYLKLAGYSGTINVEISNLSDYTTIIDKDTGVGRGGTVLIYGIATTSKLLEEPYDTYYPVISLERIDKCVFTSVCSNGSGANVQVFQK